MLKDRPLYVIMQSTKLGRGKPTTFRQENRSITQQQNQQQTKRVRHIQEQQQSKEEEPGEVTVYAEAAQSIKELMEDWASVNTVRPSIYKEINNVSLNKDTRGEIWFKTNCGETKIDWVADTGSPISFKQETTATSIVSKHTSTKTTTFTEKTK